MSAVDTIVVGGGVDGLVAALTLAKAGRKALVCEARAEVGGVAAGREFAEGYRHTGVWHDTAAFRPEVAKALGLHEHGLRFAKRPSTWAGGVLLTSEAVVGDLPEGDVHGYRRLREFLDRIQPFAAAVLAEAPPDVREEAPLWPLVKPAVGLRRLGRADMMELLKVGPSAVDDWLADHVTDPRLRAALALPGLLGTWMGPMSPTSTAYLVLREALLGPDEVVGGPAAVVEALVAACGAAGVTLRTDAPVAEVAVADDTVQGVRLADGTDLYARNVLLCTGPRRLFDLLPPLALPERVEASLAKVRVRGTLAKVHVALSAAPSFGGRDDHEHAVLADSPEHLERAFDDAKTGRLPTLPPPLDLRVPTVSDPSLAPEGHHVASALVFGVPHALRSGWTDEARTAVWEATLATLERHDHAIRDKVVAHEVLTPADLEARYDLEGGHLFHAEHALDQLWSLRPTPELARYRTPVAGLWLGSAGSHPGGHLTGLPGHLAALAIRS